MKKALIFFFILAIFLVPIASVEAAPFVGQIVPECTDGICGYCDITTLIQNIINFLIYLSVIVATLMFVYAGFIYLTAGGDSSKISAAHKVFTNVAIGLVVVLASWLIVDTVMKAFINESEFGPWNKIECRK